MSRFASIAASVIATVSAAASCAQSEMARAPANDAKKGCLNLVGAEKTNLYDYTGMIGAQSGQAIVTCSGTFVGHNAFFTAGHCIARANPNAVRYLGNDDIKATDVAARFNKGVPAVSVIHHGTNYIGMEMNLGSEAVRTRDFAIVIFPDNTAPNIAPIVKTRPPASTTVRITSYGNYTSGVATLQDKFRWSGTNVLENFANYGTSMPGISAPTKTTNAADVLAAPGDSGGGVFANDALFAVVSAGGQLSATTSINLFTDINTAANVQLIQQAEAAGAKIGVRSATQPPAPNPAPAPGPAPGPAPAPNPTPAPSPQPDGGSDDAGSNAGEDLPELKIDNPEIPLIPVDEDKDEDDAPMEVESKPTKSKKAQDDDECGSSAAKSKRKT